MKKSSIFVIIVTFILSIFMISFYGLSVRTDHMKAYITKAEITSCKLVNSDYEPPITLFYGTKTVFINFNEYQQDGVLIMFIEYTIEPQEINEGYELVLLEEGNEEFIIIENDEPVTYHYAELTKNKLTIYHSCSITIVLNTLDGSGNSDMLNISCWDLS